MGYQYDPKVDLLFHYPNQDGQGYLVPLSVLEGCQPVAVVFSASRAANIEWVSSDKQPLIINIDVPVPSPSPSALAEKIAEARGVKKETIVIARIAPFVSNVSIPPHPVMKNTEHTAFM